MLQLIRRSLGWFWSHIIIGVPKVSAVDPSQPVPEAAPVDPAAAPDTPAAAPIEAPAPEPRGVAAVLADLEGVAKKLADIATGRSALDAAESEARSILASLKAEWEAAKAKVEAIF